MVVYLVINISEGSGFNLIVSLNKDFFWGFNVFVVYIYGEVELFIDGIFF